MRGNPRLYVHQFSDQTRTRQLQQNLAYQANLEASSGAPGLVALKQQLLSRIGQATTPRPGFVGVFFCSIADIEHLDSALAGPRWPLARSLMLAIGKPCSTASRNASPGP